MKGKPAVIVGIVSYTKKDKTGRSYVEPMRGSLMLMMTVLGLDLTLSTGPYSQTQGFANLWSGSTTVCHISEYIFANISLHTPPYLYGRYRQ